MLAHVTTFAIHGVESRRVTVEVDVRPGLPNFLIVGLGDRAVREARERVRAAILNSGFEFPARRITVNLAPASLRKEGPGFDLAIACGVLAAGAPPPAPGLERAAAFWAPGPRGGPRPPRGGRGGGGGGGGPRPGGAGGAPGPPAGGGAGGGP